MILSHPTFDKMIEFNEDSINVLVIENQMQFSSYLCELNEQIRGDQGKFSLFSNMSEISFEKIKLIFSPIELSSNTKDIMSQVIQKITKYSLDEDHYVTTNEIIAEINKFLANIIFDFDPELSFSDIAVGSLFKCLNVLFEESGLPVIEKIIQFLEVCKKYCKYQLFIFVNLKSYLSDSELSQLYKFLIYSKIDVLLIESTSRCILEYENVTVIDKDLCEFHLVDR